MRKTRQRLSNRAGRKGKSKKKVELDSKTESEKHPIMSPQDSKIKEIATDLGARPKEPAIIISDGTEKKERKKKPKWKPVSLSECGFRLFRYPRPSRPKMMSECGFRPFRYPRPSRPKMMSECGFRPFRYPRPRPIMTDSKKEAAIIEKIENEIEEYGNLVEKYEKYDLLNWKRNILIRIYHTTIQIPRK